MMTKACDKHTTTIWYHPASLIWTPNTTQLTSRLHQHTFKQKNNKDKGTYDWENDTIFIRPTGYKTVKDFIITILHEIHHAKRVHRYGLDKFLKKYQQAGQVADFLGKDRYFSNKWEKKAEGWAKHEYKRYFKDKFFDV